MRNLLLPLFSMLSVCIYAQDYENRIEIKYAKTIQNFTNSSKNDTCDNLWYANNCNNNQKGWLDDNAYVMESLIYMYESTKNPKYIRILVMHIEHFLARRDDGNLSNNNNRNSATWASQISPVYVLPECNDSVFFDCDTGLSNLRDDANLLQSGWFCFPMAYLAYINFRDPAIGSIVLDPTPGLTEYTFTGPANLNDFVTVYLIPKIEETINYHESEWDNSAGKYLSRGIQYTDCLQGSAECYNGKGYPLNIQHSMGKTLVMMHMATQYLSYSGSLTSSYFINKVDKLLSLFKVEQIAYSPGALPQWRYYDIATINSFQNCNDGMSLFNQEEDNCEDVSHAGYTIHFLYLVNEYMPSTFMSYYENSTEFLRKLGDRFMNVVTRYPRCYNSEICGNDPSYNTLNNQIPTPYWLLLSEYHSSVFDWFIDDVYEAMYIKDISSTDMLTMAIANYFLRYHDQLRSPPAEFDPHKYFNVINFEDFWSTNHLSEPSPGNCFQYSSEWCDTDGGDLDNDGIDEVVTVNSDNGNYEVYKFDALTGKPDFDASWINNSSPLSWRITLVDFEDDGSKEIVVCRDTDPVVYVYGYNSVSHTIYSRCSFSIAPYFTNWSQTFGGMDGGNFNALDPAEELAIVDRSTGNIILLDWNNSTACIDNSTTQMYINGGSNAQYNELESADMDNDDRDEIVVSRNGDGNIYAYYYNGGVFYYFGQYLFNAKMDFVGMASGNFDVNNEGDELAITAASDGKKYLFRYDANSNSIERSIAEYGYGYSGIGGYKFDGLIAGGNFTGNNALQRCKAELVRLRNYDNAMHVCDIKYTQGYPNMSTTAISICPNYIDHMENKCDKEELTAVFEDKQEKISEIKIYPNPTTGIFTVDMGNQSNDIKVVVADITGKIVTESSHKERRLLSVKFAAAPGVYFVKICSENAKAVFKLIKEK